MVMQNPTIWKHLKTLELDYRTKSSGEIVQFRLELFGTDGRMGNLKKYRARAFRYDLFALKPSFQPSPANGDQFDHELAVVEPFMDNSELWAESCDLAVDEFIKRLTSQLLGTA